MNKRKEIQNLKDEIENLKDEIYEIKNSSRFEINEEVIIFYGDKNPLKAIVQDKWLFRQRYYYNLLVPSYSNFEKFIWPEDRIYKLQQLKEEICGSKTINRVKGKDRKKEESKGKN